MPWFIFKRQPPHNPLIRFIKAPSTGFNSRRKAPNNDPNRAPGMQPFYIKDMTVYAGTFKAAQKLRRRCLLYST